MNKIKKIYLLLSPLPLVSLIGFYLYLNSIEGWGAYIGVAWVIVPITVTLFCMLVGACILFLLYKKKESLKGTIFALALASVPFLLFLLRWVHMEYLGG